MACLVKQDYSTPEANQGQTVHVDLSCLPLQEPLIAAIAQLLDSKKVANVLWGNWLLTVYGVPSLAAVS